MLQFIKGNLLNANVEALVNTVNTVGVMGKGIALQFKETFPANYEKYISACKVNQLDIGNLLVVKDYNDKLGEKLIINFPTKKHWRQPSRYEYIESGLVELVNVIKNQHIRSLALPSLGCGNGGLDWNIVKPLIIKYLTDVDADILVYEPNETLKEELQKEQPEKNVVLNPVRAMFLYLLYHYDNLGEHNSLFTANKLAYFLQLSGEKMRLSFVQYHYGPYSPKVADVLYALNGKYLRGFEQKQAKPFEPLYLNQEKFEEVKSYIENELGQQQKEKLKELTRLIDGFHTELSLEALASVAFILSKAPSYTSTEVFTAIQQWNARKSKLITKDYVDIAYDRLKENSRLLQL